MFDETRSFAQRRELAAAFLVSRGARTIPHPGGTLYEHVSRTAARLRSWNARDALVLAGLCHATYGTDGFSEFLLPHFRRYVLADIIGISAEVIVYAYASCAREATYRELIEGRSLLHDRFDGTVHPFCGATLADVVELTFANELDVMQQSRELRQRVGRDLAKLSNVLAEYASPGARSAFRAELNDLAAR